MLSVARMERRLDMRSKSRLGRGDLAANAKRIQTYLQHVADNSGVQTKWLELDDPSTSS